MKLLINSKRVTMLTLFLVLALSASYFSYVGLNWAVDKTKVDDDLGSLCFVFIWLILPAAVMGWIGLICTITQRTGTTWVIEWFARTF